MVSLPCSATMFCMFSTLASSLRFLVVLALFVGLLLRFFVFGVFFVPTPSMSPTFLPGDRVVVNLLSSNNTESLTRGDVIVYYAPVDEPLEMGFFTSLLNPAPAGHEAFVKRVIAFEGETVQFIGGALHVNERYVEESYLHVPHSFSSDPVTVPPNALFVAGDMRSNSLDSRTGAGFVPYSAVAGRVFMILLPVSRFGPL